MDPGRGHQGPGGVESEENLALLAPETRTLLLICRDEGLRTSEALTLKTDCLKKTPPGHWALVHGPLQEQGQEPSGLAMTLGNSHRQASPCRYRAIPASRVVVEMIRGQVSHARQLGHTP